MKFPDTLYPFETERERIYDTVAYVKNEFPELWVSSRFSDGLPSW